MEQKRKGALRRADVTPRLLARLNRGETEALTLAEVLVVDFHQLMQSVFPDLDAGLLARMRDAAGTGWVGRTRLAGELLHEGLGLKGMKKTLGHPSDQVRGWGAALLAWKVPVIGCLMKPLIVKV